MGALTVTLGADITQLRKAMAGATELVAASGLAGLGKGGAAAPGAGINGPGRLPDSVQAA